MTDLRRWRDRRHFRGDGSQKVAYATEEDALEACRIMARRHQSCFDAYSCPLGSHWHVGQDRRKAKEQHERLWHGMWEELGSRALACLGAENRGSSDARIAVLIVRGRRGRSGREAMPTVWGGKRRRRSADERTQVSA